MFVLFAILTGFFIYVMSQEPPGRDETVVVGYLLQFFEFVCAGCFLLWIVSAWQKHPIK